MRHQTVNTWEVINVIPDIWGILRKNVKIYQNNQMRKFRKCQFISKFFILTIAALKRQIIWAEKQVSWVTLKLRVTGLCAGNSPVTGEFPHKWPITRKMLPLDDVIMQWLYFDPKRKINGHCKVVSPKHWEIYINWLAPGNVVVILYM